MSRIAILKKRGPALVPANRRGEVALEGLREGEVIKAEIKRERNPAFHRLYWAMIQAITDALNRGPAQTTPEQLHEWLKIKLGHYELVELPPAAAKAIDQSHAIRLTKTDFKSMDQEAFKGFVGEATRLIRENIAPWIIDAPEWREVSDMLRSIDHDEAA